MPARAFGRGSEGKWRGTDTGTRRVMVPCAGDEKGQEASSPGACPGECEAPGTPAPGHQFLSLQEVHLCSFTSFMTSQTSQLH